MDVACPQCGNPNLDVDAQNSVVYCKKCGFAVRVDPQSGEVTPLTQGGGAPAGGGAAAAPQTPEAYAGGEKTIFGMEPFLFLLVATTIILAAAFTMNFDLTIAAILETLAIAYYYMKR